jgi:hypothetical protein
MSEQEIFVGICIISQKGGTAKKASGDVYANINNKQLTLTEIRKAIEIGKLRFTVR